jgi:hypothetical protein
MNTWSFLFGMRSGISLGASRFWFILLCASGVSVQAGWFEGRDAHERGDYRAAVNEFRPIAEKGNVWAQIYLGEMYEDGKGVPQDYQQAKTWYQKAAEQGDPSARRRLAWLHNNHKIVLLVSEISRWPDTEGKVEQHRAENGESAIPVIGEVTNFPMVVVALVFVAAAIWLRVRHNQGVSGVVGLLESLVTRAETFVEHAGRAVIELLQKIHEWMVERIRRVVAFISDVVKLIGRLVKVLVQALLVFSPALGSVALAVYVPSFEGYKGSLLTVAVFWVVMVVMGIYLRPR